MANSYTYCTHTLARTRAHTLSALHLAIAQRSAGRSSPPIPLPLIAPRAHMPSHWPSGFRNMPPNSQHTTSATLNRGLCRHKRCRHLRFPYFLLLHFVSHFSNFFLASLLFISFAPGFLFLVPSLNHTPASKSTESVSGKFRSAEQDCRLSCSRGGTCVDKSKSRLTSDMCRMGWRHWDRGTGENRNVYTLTRADDVPWCRPSAGIISLWQNTCGNCAETLLRMTFTQSEQYRGSSPGR